MIGLLESILGPDFCVVCIFKIMVKEVWNSCFGLDPLAADLAAGHWGRQAGRALGRSRNGRTNFKQRLTAEKKPLITPPAADGRRDGRRTEPIRKWELRRASERDPLQKRDGNLGKGLSACGRLNISLRNGPRLCDN